MSGVNCGAHVAESCQACPAGNGPDWCHGMCEWVTGPFGGGECAMKGAMGAPEVVPLPPILKDPEEWEFFSIEYAGFFAMSAVIMFCFACAYYDRVVQHIPTMEDIAIKRHHRRGLFSCLFDFPTCMYVAFCTPLVQGKNCQIANVCGFWAGCICSFMCMFSPCFPVFVLYRTYISREIQQQIGNQKTGCCWQLCLSLFCYPCDLGRESLECDEEAGAEISCINRLHLTQKLWSMLEDIKQETKGKLSDSRNCSAFRNCS